MKTRPLVLFASLLLPALASAATPSRGRILQPDQLVILSTTDVKGRTSPCGCHVPKGGLARRAGFADSIRAQFGQVAVVDAGGFFPDSGGRLDLAAFQMDAMNLLKTDAVGIAERDLRYGASCVTAQAKRSRLPVVCANLIEKRSGKPLFDPYVIKEIGGVKVGFFGLIGAKVDLGPSRDSLVAEEPAVVARRTIAELRRRSVDVVVLLGQLGTVESEALVTAVDGVDALVVGAGTSVSAQGRLIKNTVACYGGEQGYYVCKTVLTLDSRQQVTTRAADAIMLGPEVAEQRAMHELVKGFEDGYNERLRKAEAERAARAARQDGGSW
jgi:5'-nucleotidase/UDP-sugar diphosphatase